ncbi:MAG: MFS transporter [Youngiibacter sp.]|nr:MFS transporter [Youngiibacter sp.]
MNRDPKTMNPTLLAIVLLSIGLNDVTTGAAAAAIASMIKEFPQYSVTTIQLVVTLPNIMVMFIAPMYGWLSTKFNQRKLIIFGVFAFVFFGALPSVLNNFVLIAISRALLGVGSGITIPANIASINVLYDGYNNDKLIGYDMALGCIGGIVTQMLGGYLALIGWRYAFLAYLFSIWVLVLTVMYLPDVKESEEVIKQRKANTKLLLFKVYPKVYGLILVYLSAATFRTMLPVNLSIVIETNGIGTSANSGIALSLFTAGAFIGGLVFGRLKRKLKGYTISFTWLLIGTGFLLFTMSSTILTIYLTTFISGIGMGMMIPGYFTRVTEISNPEWVGLSIALIAAVQGLGNFINPVVAGWLINIFDKKPGYFPVSAASVFLLTGGVIIGLLYTFERNWKANKITDII